MILNTAKDWIMKEIVEKVTVKLLSMLDPTGIMAVVNSAIAFFKAIQSAIEYLTDILKIVDDWVSTVAAIAKGAITPGAQKLESGFAGAIPVAIGFLANQVGLGDVPEKVREIIVGCASSGPGPRLADRPGDPLGQAALDALTGGPAVPPGAGGPGPAEARPSTSSSTRCHRYDGATTHQRTTGPTAALVLHSVPDRADEARRRRPHQRR